MSVQGGDRGLSFGIADPLIRRRPADRGGLLEVVHVLILGRRPAIS